MSTLSPTELTKIRAAARRIIRRADLPKSRTPAGYKWHDEAGSECATNLEKRDRQFFEALQQGPIFCASPVRLSDAVLRLRREHGLPVETEFFTERDGDEALTFGVYHLTAEVMREVQ